MNSHHANTFPKLHNAAWPGVVGKGGEGAEPPIDLDTMLDLTAKAEVDGITFDGVNLFLFAPHVDIDATYDDLERLASKVRDRNLVIGSVVAPVWPPTGGGSAADEGEGRAKFLEQIKKGCKIAGTLRDLGVRPYGIVRFDSACGVGDWAKDPEGNQKRSRKHSSKRLSSRAITANAWRPKGKSAGAGCTLGGRWLIFLSASASRKPSAFRRTWRTRYSTRSARTPPRIASCRRITIGRIRRSSTRP